MHIRDKIIDLIHEALEAMGTPRGMVAVNLDHPTDQKFGDYSTNVAMLLMKQLGATHKNPLDLAQKIAEKLTEVVARKKCLSVERAEAVAPGFVNIHLSKKYFTDAVADAVEKASLFGKNTKLWNQRVIAEYTDPNPFKQFHIGHLMSNAIGESLARMLEFHDAKVTRACYSGDVGLHVAKALWGMKKLEAELPEKGSLDERSAFLGRAYVAGAKAYEEDENAKAEIAEINKKAYDKSDEKLNALYDWGKKASVDHFKIIFDKLGTHFDHLIFESEVAADGMEIVQGALDRGILEKSDGAVIYPGEKHGLHNRVFVTSQGLPTYEAKELGLTKRKFELGDFDQSIVVTAHEQNDYYKVILSALRQIFPVIAERTKHLGHGMMRFASGKKMGSRTGNVITGESLLADIEEMVMERIQDRELSDAAKKEIATKVAVAAIKYSILKQSVGRDIPFDPDKSISFEGDSGPYIQYAYVRTQAIKKKAEGEGVKANAKAPSGDAELPVERLLYKFPEVVERAAADFAPQYIATFLVDLAGEFNSYYAKQVIVDKKDPASPYRLALTEAVGWALRNGLYLLGISAPEKM